MAAPASSFFAPQLSRRFLHSHAITTTGSPVATCRFLNLYRSSRSRRSILTTAGSWPPPSQPSSGKDPNFLSRVQSMFSRAEDGLRIFFAVLFWMSLFFWGSAWESGDDDKKKGM